MVVLSLLVYISCNCILIMFHILKVLDLSA